MTYVLGLDFGTVSTAAAVSRDGVVRVATLGNRVGAVPAVVFVRADGSLLHGEDAFMRGGSEPSRLVRDLKRRLGNTSPVVIEGQSFDPVALVASHLRWAVDRVADQEGGPPDRIVLTHPAIWKEVRLDGLRRAIDAAGLDPVLVSEPLAAASFHEQSTALAIGDVVGVYDLGGGTFDAAVLRRVADGFELVGRAEGEDHLGGIDFDDVVLHLVQSRLGDRWKEAQRAAGNSFAGAVANLRRECVAAKESLSVEDSVEIPVVLPGLVAPVVVTRRDIEHHIGPAIDESIGSFRRAVSRGGLTPADLSAVLLVGGSCRLPIVRASLAKALGASVALLDTDPQFAVARGAAIIADSLLDDAEPAPSQPQPAVWAPPSSPQAAAPFPASPQPPVRDSGHFEPQPAASWTRPAAEPLSLPAYARTRRRPRLAVALAGVAAASVVGIAVLWFLNRDDPGAAEATEVANASDNGADGAPVTSEPAESGALVGAADAGAEPPSAPIASGVDMVAVPAGSSLLGVDAPSAESVASFTATVESFSIDEFEVTNEQYLAFVQQIGAPAPITWERGAYPDDASGNAVAGVEFVWAQAYCEALEKRLPTEAEWEVAARGPNGSLYPTGDTPDGLDLETEGSRPVGSVEANVSAVGAFDMVGGVWEWVGEPYVPVDEGSRVRRGGQDGRVRDGAAMRQAVDPNGQATISETGFRCAADAVDPAVPALQFSVEHERPSETGDQSGPVAVGAGETALVNDSFEDTGSGFSDIDVGVWRMGYHSPTWYHLEATQPNVQLISLGGFDLADGDVELRVYIDKLGTDTGQYRYGLVFRSAGAAEEPPVGVVGPARPHDFYAFVINPRAGTWELLHKDELPLRVKQTGPLPDVAVTDPAAPDVLAVSMRGSEVVMSVNGEAVGVFDTEGFHIGAGNLGLYAETFDETLVHAHFDLLTVN